MLYIGVFIGFITTAVLFPRILTEEEIGLINTLLAYSIVFAQFATLGFNSVITKFLPISEIIKTGIIIFSF